MNKQTRIEKIISQTKDSNYSDFYRQLWKDIGNEISLDTLPLCSVSRLIETPISKRLYSAKKSITKIVKQYNIPFLIERTLKDISEENFGYVCKRPFVFLSNSHEAVEKSLWFYENNMLPLIGENNNVHVAVSSAVGYKIDGLIVDDKTANSFLPLLEKEYDVSKINTITLIGDNFDTIDISKLIKKYQKVRFVLALAETGAFAESCPEMLHDGILLFHEDENSVVEEGNCTVITKAIFSPTPIIRYQTNITTTIGTKYYCCCKKKGFLLH